MLLSMGAHAGVGDIDKRVYVDWSQPPYTKIVYFYPKEYATCTAQYVARDIILTARHCITDEPNYDKYEKVGNTYEIKLYDGRKTMVRLEKYGRNTVDDDWALLRITDTEFYSNDFFDVSDDTEYIAIENAGFGYMRILSDDEIKQLKEIFLETIAANTGVLRFDVILGKSAESIESSGIPRLRDNGIGEREYKLKADKTCGLFRARMGDRTIGTSCDNWGGNSGGAYFSNNTLYGIVSKGIDAWDDEYNMDRAVSPELYYKSLQEMKSSSQNTASVAQAPEETKIAVPASPLSENPIQTQETELQQVSDVLVSQAQNIENMTDADFLQFLGHTTEYSVLKDNLAKAKARETSLGNRTLGAAAIGAGGYGGMMALQGMAEQSADENADQGMRAYLETFRCDYGQGKNHRGGDLGIEIPGNILFASYQEYVNLATNIHKDKELLGMAPGIESEVILDKADGGLYDNESLGITGGAFASRARALLNPDGKDATVLNEQKSDAKSKVNTGTLVGSAGVLGGAVGNLIINNDKDKEEK